MRRFDFKRILESKIHMEQERFLTYEQFKVRVLDIPAGKHRYSNLVFSIPPFHPAMRSGIPRRLAAASVPLALEYTLEDFKRLSSQNKAFEEEVGELESITPREIQQSPNGIIFSPFPLMHQLFIGNFTMNHSSHEGADPHISIQPNLSRGLFSVPKANPLTDRLKAIYDANEERTDSTSITYSTNNAWYHHNLAPASRIFFKNLILILNNEVENTHG